MSADRTQVRDAVHLAACFQDLSGEALVQALALAAGLVKPGGPGPSAELSLFALYLTEACARAAGGMASEGRERVRVRMPALLAAPAILRAERRASLAWFAAWEQRAAAATRSNTRLLAEAVGVLPASTVEALRDERLQRQRGRLARKLGRGSEA